MEKEQTNLKLVCLDPTFFTVIGSTLLSTMSVMCGYTQAKNGDIGTTLCPFGCETHFIKLSS